MYQVENANTEKLSECDIVCLTKQFEDIAANTEGTIVYAYSSADEYEVEFVINDTSIVRTISGDCLIKKK